MDTSSNCPPGFSIIAFTSNLILLVGLVLYTWLDPVGLASHLTKDGAKGGGAFEQLTVIVLIPGILVGLHAYWRYRVWLPHPILAYWLLAWSLACIYFAGEEASWGQWYFRWETPHFLTHFNDQGETNLHNMTSWLDQKPRAMVELFIFLGGFLAPLRRICCKSKPIIRSGLLSAWEGWVSAPNALLPAGLLFVMVRIADWLPLPALKDFGDSELREFVIAWFLTWYLASYAVRLRKRAVQELY